MEQREIKFRAWDKLQNKMLYPETFSEDVVIQLGGVVGLFNGKTYDTATDDFVLMQFTGIKDSLGVEIYESDIIHVNGKREVVEWKEFDDHQGWTIDTDDLNLIVCGNSFQHPELIK